MATSAMGTVFSITLDGVKTRVGKLSSIGEIAPESEEMEITTLDSTDGYREYMQGVKSAGEIEVEGFFAAGDEGQVAIRAAFASGAQAAFEIAFTDETRVEFSGFVKGYTIGASEIEKPIAFGARIRISGAVTVL